ncbi:hypothetical protein CTI12_AA537670 [Artemisia annua]|uniref:Uncharacterized protein n=1 Tax=Artemisia annua TaxID=35608 RepID=A0A2U1KY38_ARTAN|nr:hypothetical protein CTI12_AA537670 [Artemisia annua]
MDAQRHSARLAAASEKKNANSPSKVVASQANNSTQKKKTKNRSQAAATNRSSSKIKKSSSNSKRAQVDVNCFLPIRYIAQLRRLITGMEAEIISDEQMVLECKEAIDKRREKMLEYQQTINNVTK